MKSEWISVENQVHINIDFKIDKWVICNYKIIANSFLFLFVYLALVMKAGFTSSSFWQNLCNYRKIKSSKLKMHPKTDWKQKTQTSSHIHFEGKIPRAQTEGRINIYFSNKIFPSNGWLLPGKKGEKWIDRRWIWSILNRATWAHQEYTYILFLIIILCFQPQ